MGFYDLWKKWIGQEKEPLRVGKWLRLVDGTGVDGEKINPPSPIPAPPPKPEPKPEPTELEKARESLKEGDIVKWKHRGEYVTGTITEVVRNRDSWNKFGTGSIWRLWVRRNGRTKSGRRYPIIHLEGVNSVFPVKIFDATVSNIYADFLEEMGEESAARKLREQFPLGPPK